MISIIVACDANRGIGRNGTIPWHFPSDLQWFKEVTRDNVVIMGRKTYESLPEKVRPLPNRHNIVVTSNKIDGVQTADSLKKAIFAASLYGKEIFLIGGQRIYEEGLAYADQIFMTQIHDAYENMDTFFPKLSDNWVVKEQDTFCDRAGKDGPIVYDYYVLVRPNSGSR